MVLAATKATSCAAGGTSDSTVYDTTALSEQPVVRSAPAIDYPAEARRRKIQGRVVITAVVTAEGAVEASSVVVATSAAPLLDDEARRVVALARFWPGCREGQPVWARIAVPFEFKAGADRAGLGFAVLAGLWTGIMAATMH